MTAIQTLDLSMLEGITTYIEQMLLQDVRKVFANGKGLQPFGVALGTVTNGTKLPRPQVMAVGSYGMGLRNTKRSLRSLAKNSAAEGTILVYLTTIERKGTTRDDEVVVVQLEHKEFGDLLWTATVIDGKLGEFTDGLRLADAPYVVGKTKMMPARWMH